MNLKNYSLLVCFLIIYSFRVQSQTSVKTIISVPSVDDYNSLTFLEKYIDSNLINLNNKPIVLFMDSFGLFSIKGVEDGVSLDTNSFYCSQQNRIIQKYKLNDYVKVYGVSITSDIFDYLKRKNLERYSALDNQSIRQTGFSIRHLILKKELANYPIIRDSIIEIAELDKIEKVIFENWILKSNEKISSLHTNDYINSNVLSVSNFIWFHEWTYDMEINNTKKINLIPKRLNSCDLISSYRRNKIHIDPNNYFLLKKEHIPRRIYINDYYRVKKKDILNDTNLFINGTSSCKNY